MNRLSKVILSIIMFITLTPIYYGLLFSFNSDDDLVRSSYAIFLSIIYFLLIVYIISDIESIKKDNTSLKFSDRYKAELKKYKNN